MTLLLAAALALARPSAATSYENECDRGSGSARDAACLIEQAAQDLEKARREYDAYGDSVEGTLRNLLELKPYGRPGRYVDFQVYFKKLVEVEQEFLKQENYDALKRARDKFEWAYVQLREAFRNENEVLKTALDKLEKIDGLVESAQSKLRSASSDASESAERELDELMKRAKALEEQEEKAAAAIQDAASQASTLLYRLDSDHNSISSKLSLTHYSNYRQVPDRENFVQSAEKNEIKALRSSHGTAYAAIEKALAAL